MKPIYLSILTLILAGVVSYATVKAVQPQVSADGTVIVEKVTKKKADESVYDRVMRSGEIKCAYIIYPPIFDRDVNTGEFSGLNYDIMMEVGRQLDFKINWVEEVGTDNAFSGLDTGRYDAICMGFWEIPTRSKAALFTDPLYYEGVYAFAREDDTRFDSGKYTINAPETTIVVLEGEMSQYLAQEEFSKAKMVTQPGMTGASVRFLDVASGKGDVTFNERTVYNDYDAANPGKVKQLYPEPLRVSNASFSVARGEHDLAALLNSTISSMHNAGKIKPMLRKYDPEGTIYLSIINPYEVSE